MPTSDVRSCAVVRERVPGKPTVHQDAQTIPIRPVSGFGAASPKNALWLFIPAQNATETAGRCKTIPPVIPCGSSAVETLMSNSRNVYALVNGKASDTVVVGRVNHRHIRTRDLVRFDLEHDAHGD